MPATPSPPSAPMVRTGQPCHKHHRHPDDHENHRLAKIGLHHQQWRNDRCQQPVIGMNTGSVAILRAE
jgi:hypothetical protein